MAKIILGLISPEAFLTIELYLNYNKLITFIMQNGFIMTKEPNWV